MYDGGYNIESQRIYKMLLQIGAAFSDNSFWRLELLEEERSMCLVLHGSLLLCVPVIFSECLVGHEVLFLSEIPL